MQFSLVVVRAVPGLGPARAKAYVDLTPPSGQRFSLPEDDPVYHRTRRLGVVRGLGNGRRTGRARARVTRLPGRRHDLTDLTHCAMPGSEQGPDLPMSGRFNFVFWRNRLASAW
jgi:hypothetical protein